MVSPGERGSGVTAAAQKVSRRGRRLKVRPWSFRSEPGPCNTERELCKQIDEQPSGSEFRRDEASSGGDLPHFACWAREWTKMPRVAARSASKLARAYCCKKPPAWAYITLPLRINKDHQRMTSSCGLQVQHIDLPLLLNRVKNPTDAGI